MRLTASAPTSSSSGITATHHPAAAVLWRSPMPFLFGGIAATILLITAALLILLCTHYRNSRSSTTASSSSDHQSQFNDLEKATSLASISEPQVEEPKIVVVMAGNDVPTFLAKPISFVSVTAPNPQANYNDHALH